MATNYFLTNRYEEALSSLKKAFQLDPKSVDIQKMYRECEIFTYFERGNKLSNKGLFNEAISYYQKVIELDPDFAGAYHNLAKILQQQGYIDEAIQYCQKAIDLNPNFASFFNLAELLSYKRMFQEALEYYFEALQINANDEWVYFKIANILQDTGYIEDSIKYYEKSLQINPHFAFAYNNLGNALRSQKNLDEAMQCYQKASEINPAFIEAKYNIGTTLGEQGRIDEAERIYEKILEDKPDYLLARWAKCMSRLPVIYLDESEIHSARKAYHEELIKLQDAIDLETPEGINSAVEAVGTQQPFFLTCQGLNDRNLQKIYGEMVCKIMAKKYPHYAGYLHMPYCNKATRIRVGIVSSLFHWHSVWKIPLSGWVLNLNKRFDLYCYHIGKSKDHITDIARKNCKRFVEDISFFEDLCHIIRNDNLHILLYPEIGMDPLTLKLATLRLAPVQCVTLGHPDTTGLPTIDYYLSSDLMEPPDADEHYTERLIRLPNLSFYYTPFDVPEVEINRKDFKLRHNAVVYLCSHALFTHLPQFDYVYPRIAQEVDNCQFVFISIKPYLTDKFYTRIAGTFKQNNLNPDEYLVILPTLDQHQYLKLNQLSDIFLDTISWSANNSSFEAVACNLPIVTLPGPLMRQRHSSAILTMMGVTETIASSIEDYIALAIRLGKDTTFRSQISEKMATNKFRVYQDKACIEALEKFIEDLVRGK